MASANNLDLTSTSCIKEKIEKNRTLGGNIETDDTACLLNEFHERVYRKNMTDSNTPLKVQELINGAFRFLKMVKSEETFKVAKVCQIWEQILQFPDITLTTSVSENLVDWFCLIMELECNQLIMTDILSCLAVAIHLKEIKQTKGLERVLSPSGFLITTLMKDQQITNQTLLTLKILCNFTSCSGEKDWSTISRNLIETCILQFVKFQECHLQSDVNDLFMQALVISFRGLENIFVRFSDVTKTHLDSILGLARHYMLFGIPGQSWKYTPIVPSSLPVMEFPLKSEQTRNPKVRKKRHIGNSPSKCRNQDNFEELDSEVPANASTKQPAKVAIVSSSDSELSDTDTQVVHRSKETQVKVRSVALKMLSAAFKFCDQRSVMKYWSAFLPDSSQTSNFRHTLITPILKDSSVKVRCDGLIALSSLLQAIQPTLAMASYQENKTGAFIPLSQTIAETIVTVQRSLLLSLGAEQSTNALIQLLKCLSVAASVFPYEKLPTDLVSKTVQQCFPFLKHKDPDVKVACLSVYRIILCARPAQPHIVRLFSDENTGKCWLMEHCLGLIDGHSGFPLTLESLLVIGEVARSNIHIAQPYLEQITHLVCRKLLSDQDSGIQIRCAKVLCLVGASILQEMDKDDRDQIVSRDQAAFLWMYIIQHGLAEILQTSTISPLKAEACATLATVGSQIFECLSRELRVLIVTLTLGCAADADAGVRAAAVRTLGFAVTFNTLNDDASFLLDCSEKVLPLLHDANLLVALNASWALGNLADTLDKDQNSLLEELPQHFLTNVIQAAIYAAQGPMKVRCNGIRALGIFLKIIKIVPSPGCEMAILLDQAISIVVKQATTGNFMKNRWNACYACGNILQNLTLLGAFSHWMDKVLDCLLTVFRSCPNFKVRISAANAILHLRDRELMTNYYMRIWVALLDSLAASEQIEDFSEYQHQNTMCRQICNALCKLITLMTQDDLGQLHEAIMNYYDIFSSHFNQFLKSLLPEQLELVIEAANYVQQLGLSNSSLTYSQRSTIELLQELLVVPS